MVYLIITAVRCINNLQRKEKQKLFKSIFNIQFLISVKEIFFECLIHRKIFKKNPRLGFMHTSIALGWFMMILIGHIEVKLYAPDQFLLPYYAVFLRFFTIQSDTVSINSLLSFSMDFFLLLTLAGVGLALYKRFRSMFFGMHRTTRLKKGDFFAMNILWVIFPLRLLSESLVQSNVTGNFLTKSTGQLLGSFTLLSENTILFWWAYSISLCIFFFALPHSRYMHIPSEILLIFMRNAGIKINSESKISGYTRINMLSCSQCGICLDSCQMQPIDKLRNHASAYFLRQIRYNEVGFEKSAHSCLMCGRCVDACPVGINSCSIKQNIRNRSNPIGGTDQYNYIRQHNNTSQSPEPEVIYFAGCMTHLTPGIKQSMLQIFKQSKTNFLFMDEAGSICCGRPIMLAGQIDAAKRLIDTNKKIIVNSGAQILVTSCPICYRAFREMYNLEIEVLHHTQYLHRIITQGKLELKKSKKQLVFHDSCELARYSGIVNEPRNILHQIAELKTTEYDKENSICCGGSIGSISMTSSQRKKISINAVNKLTKDNPDCLVTSCPLCKKTFTSVANYEIKDIAQIVEEAIIKINVNQNDFSSKN